MYWIEPSGRGWRLTDKGAIQPRRSWWVASPEELGRLSVELTSRGSDHGIDLDAGGG